MRVLGVFSFKCSITVYIYLIFYTPNAAAQSPDSPAADRSPTESNGFAQRVYLDPNTGQLLSKPPPGVPVLALSSAELNMLSMSDAGLVESALPSGAYLVDLQGRFRHVAVATLADDGKIKISDFSGEVFLPDHSAQQEESEKNE